MSFNSVDFAIFFPIVVTLYFLTPKSRRWILLLIASCIFYMAFIPQYILILFYLVIIDYVMGRAIEASRGKTRKLFLIVSIIANVGTLFFFKYFNFFNTNVAVIAHFFNWNYSLEALSIALPLGLSFHTFQSLAYVIEVYKGRYHAERHLGIYALYVMFFPQLVAGPIERPQQLLPQLHSLDGFNESNVTTGLRIMLWGFFKKLVVADTLGSLVDTVYANPHGVTGASLAFAAVAFAFQLYGDFSGYSDIARGSAKVFGINLVNNFRIPYFSQSIADFWRRWHISLSSWFRDYFYAPLALSWARASAFGLSLALITTFAVLGLWHGAAWTYVAFGTWFGVVMVIEQATKRFRAKVTSAIGLAKIPRFHAFLQTLITFTLVCIGFVFFRSTSMGEAWYIIGHMWSGWSNFFHQEFWTSGKFSGQIFNQIDNIVVYTRLFLLPLSTAVMVFGEYLEHKIRVNAWLARQAWWFQWAAYYVLIFWIFAFGYYGQRTFIYFQF
jgi:D-alanyl-lipoteichoic acid acyltransferase DltB (MBOAT superfamily)